MGRNFEKYVCAPKDISKLKHRLDPLSCSKHCREVRQVDFDELDRIGLKYMNGNLHLENETIFPNVKVMKYIDDYDRRFVIVKSRRTKNMLIFIRCVSL